MKKKYIAPQATVHIVKPASIMAGSIGFGNETTDTMDAKSADFDWEEHEFLQTITQISFL